MTITHDSLDLTVQPPSLGSAPPPQTSDLGPPPTALAPSTLDIRYETSPRSDIWWWKLYFNSVKMHSNGIISVIIVIQHLSYLPQFICRYQFLPGFEWNPLTVGRWHHQLLKLILAQFFTAKGGAYKYGLFALSQW